MKTSFKKASMGTIKRILTKKYGLFGHGKDDEQSGLGVNLTHSNKESTTDGNLKSKLKRDSNQD